MDTNIQKYMAFVATVEYGSFTKAAEVLHYSQSGISRMIRDLEREWHLVLLERGKAGVRLTGEGMKLLPYARRMCREYEYLSAEVDKLNGLQTGLIRIGTFSSVATHRLPMIIAEFQKKYPRIEFELLMGDYAEIEAWIREGRVDFGFLRLPAPPDLETIFFEQDRLLAVLPESHPLAEMAEFPVSAFAAEPFILLEKGGKSEVAELLEVCGVTPSVRFTTWDDYAVMSMTECGLGIGILPALILQRNPYRIVAKELNVPAWRNIGIVLRDKEIQSPAVARFMEYLPQ